MTTIKDIAYLGSRFFALYILYQFSLNISFAINSIIFAQQINLLAFLTYGSLIIIYLLFFVVFWFKAEKIASLVLGDYANKETTTSESATNLERAVFILVGILILTKATPNLVGQIISDHYQPRPISNNSIVAYSKISVQIIISLFLIFGADFFSKLLNKFRN